MLKGILSNPSHLTQIMNLSPPFRTLNILRHPIKCIANGFVWLKTTFRPTMPPRNSILWCISKYRLNVFQCYYGLTIIIIVLISYCYWTACCWFIHDSMCPCDPHSAQGCLHLEHIQRWANNSFWSPREVIFKLYSLLVFFCQKKTS